MFAWTAWKSHTSFTLHSHKFLPCTFTVFYSKDSSVTNLNHHLSNQQLNTVYNTISYPQSLSIFLSCPWVKIFSKYSWCFLKLPLPWGLFKGNTFLIMCFSWSVFCFHCWESAKKLQLVTHLSLCKLWLIPAKFVSVKRWCISFN